MFRYASARELKFESEFTFSQQETKANPCSDKTIKFILRIHTSKPTKGNKVSPFSSLGCKIETKRKR